VALLPTKQTGLFITGTPEQHTFARRVWWERGPLALVAEVVSTGLGVALWPFSQSEWSQGGLRMSLECQDLHSVCKRAQGYLAHKKETNITTVTAARYAPPQRQEQAEKKRRPSQNARNAQNV